MARLHSLARRNYRAGEVCATSAPSRMAAACPAIARRQCRTPSARRGCPALRSSGNAVLRTRGAPGMTRSDMRQRWRCTMPEHSDHHRLRQLRPHAGHQGRPRQGRRLRRHLSCRSTRRRFSTACSSSRSSTSPRFPARASSARSPPAPRNTSASRRSCRACSAIPASTSARTPASPSPRTCAASASACPSTRSPPWSGCAACCSTSTA